MIVVAYAFFTFFVAFSDILIHNRSFMISIIPKVRPLCLIRRHLSSASTTFNFISPSQKTVNKKDPSRTNSALCRPNTYSYSEDSQSVNTKSSTVFFSNKAVAQRIEMTEQQIQDNSKGFRRLPCTVKPTHYALTLKPNLSTFTFDGSQDINLQVRMNKIFRF